MSGLAILFALVLVFALVVAMVLESRRRDELGAVAEQIGFSYERGMQPLPAELDGAGFYLFTQGAAQGLNRLDGHRGGFAVTVLEFGYDAPIGEEGVRGMPNAGDDGRFERHLQTVAWIRSDSKRLPDFDLSPTRGALRRVGPRFGMQLVTLDGREDFRGAYVLLGRDPQGLRRHFDSAAVDRLLRQPGWFLEGRGGQWLVYRLDQRVPAGETAAWIDEAIALIQTLGPT